MEICGGMWGIVYLYPHNPPQQTDSMRFFGNIEAKIDAKGRVFFPAQFRKLMLSVAEEKLIMRKDIHQNCLVLYRESVWNSEVDHLRNRLNRWNSAHQTLFRQFVSDAEIITPDSSGRILIPKRYLKMCGINQEVKFIGMDDTIELWPNEQTEAPFMSPDTFGTELEKIMDAEDPRPDA